MQLKKHKFWRDYLFAERNYLAIGVLLKLAVGVIVLVAIRR
jgi:hypothetical protein